MFSFAKSRLTGKNLFFIFIFLFSFLYATIINVPTPYATIQAGITAATNGDTVLVQPGTYVENINFNGKLITVGSLFLTTQDTSYISSTIIDGNATSRVVSFLNGENSSAILKGFTITNGSSTYGGGIYCNGASPSLENLIITGNTASFAGGGISCYNCSPILENVAIIGNTADNRAGGVNCENNSAPTLENVTIVGNTAAYYGGAIFCDTNSNPVVVNSILWDNSPEELYVNSGSVTATYSDIQGGYTGIGNIDSDPLFVDTGNGDYHLQQTSPCIDAGDPASSLDPDGTIADMGAYYFHQYFGLVWHISTTGSDITGDGSEEFPFATIQHGINCSADTDTVLVQPGTYVENINYNGELITLGSLFLTTQDTSYISTTIIDGDSIGSVVTFESGEDLSAVLCGLTITNGFGEGGGGIFCYDTSPTLKDLVVTDNIASPYGGGGIFCVASNPSLENVIISGNYATAGYGGGIHGNITNSNNVKILGNSAGYGGGVCGIIKNSENIIISGNSATYGGGMHGDGPSGVGGIDNSENVIISGNFATDGGGMYGGFMIDSKVIISGNSVSGKGGGIYCNLYCVGELPFNNLTLSGNSAAYGGGIYCSYATIPILENCILWNNSPEEIYLENASEPVLIKVSYSNIQGGESGIVVNNGTVQWQAGNIDQDPLFVDPENGNYHLSWANFPIQDETMSPCIDTGNPGSALDPDDTRADMGCYYFPQYILAEFQADTTLGIVPFTVNFTDNSVLVTGTVDEWYWDFGDGESSTLQNPTHIFSDLGYHTISLTVTGNNDSTDTEIKTDYIAVTANEQPASPANVDINIIGNDVELSWNEVNSSIYGNFLLTDYYLIYNSLDPYSNFSFHGFITDTCYTHQSVSQFSNKMFYQVTSYVGGLDLLQDVIAKHPDFKLGELDLLIEEKRLRVNKSFRYLDRK